MTDVWFLNNTASSSGGAIDNHGGDSLIMDRVTFESNTSAAEGGALKTDAPATLRNVTFSGNISSMAGGALEVSGGSTVLVIENSTFANNVSSIDGGAIKSGSNIVSLTNSVFSGNVASGSDNVINGNVSSGGFNLVDDAAYADGIATDIVGEDPKLGPLQDNGGYVKTHELLSGSPAINAGGGVVKEDATGVSQDIFPDIGAYESRDAHIVPKLFWTDMTNKVIYRANEDGSALQPIITTAETPFDIEVDDQNGLIYWVEGEGNYAAGGGLGSLYSANLDGLNKTELVAGLLFPTGVALDIASGHIYLTIDSTTTNTSSAPYVNEIVRFDLDGSGRQSIASGEYTEAVPNRLVAPTDVEYDPASQRLFWTDRGFFSSSSDTGDEIKLVDLSAGAAQIQVIGRPSDAAHSPAALFVMPGGGEFYWANTQGISYVEYDTAVQSESNSAPLSSTLVLGVQYHSATDKIYLTDYDGNIKTVSRDLVTSTTLFGGLDDPAAIAVASSEAVSLPSIMAVNSGLSVLEGGSGVIDDALSKVTDGDTTDAALVYTVTSAPVNGRLLDSFSSTRSSFTQLELNSGEISYQHFGDENTVDSFTL